MASNTYGLVPGRTRQSEKLNRPKEDRRVATEAAWLNGNRFTERRKRKCALTSTGLLRKGSNRGCRGSTELAIVAARRSWREVFLWKTRRMKKKERRKKW